ncbi:hypothetical protein TeGR_g2312 [Tetraparma gracilis]|uniref:Eukaryotic translation initiation factor 3 subunit I n=1 Tax=Tetraparma gracilis TaxID=2962635 RepID=A0ABQ6M666_9STRA|nr:hypothetical protein TeGR_g2312 [Tetraparma gracilis]
MRPILLKGHERSITYVSFNKDGDLLFTASKDNVPTVWNASTGDRMGTYNGHQGAVWDMDPDAPSERLLTASADATVRLWQVEDGKEIACFKMRGPARGVAWSDGGRSFAVITDPFMDNDACITIFDAPPGAAPESLGQARLEIPLPLEPKLKATNVFFLNLNEALFVTFDDGSFRLYDPVSGELLDTRRPHEKKINRVSFNKEKTMFITSSADCTSKLPVNDAVISPDREHILLGGGQEAMSVTTTSGRAGKFETRFFHLVYEEEFGIVKGHFGPINALAVNPDGRSYASGAEDGYVRLHFYDDSYLNMKDPVPDVEESN